MRSSGPVDSGRCDPDPDPTTATDAAMTDPIKTLYDEDFLVWSRQQAKALRSAARGSSNQTLDWQNLAEEIEDLGKRERRELASRVSTIIEHLIKLARSPA